jgi:hypothetical protein
MEDMWLQCDVPAHFILIVHSILNKQYLAHWIGCGSPACPIPLSWSSHNPDFTTPDNSFWGIMKGEVASHCAVATVTTCAELWNTHSPPLHHKCFNAR